MSPTRCPEPGRDEVGHGPSGCTRRVRVSENTEKVFLVSLFFRRQEVKKEDLVQKVYIKFTFFFYKNSFRYLELYT